MCVYMYISWSFLNLYWFQINKLKSIWKSLAELVSLNVSMYNFKRFKFLPLLGKKVTYQNRKVNSSPKMLDLLELLRGVLPKFKMQIRIHLPRLLSSYIYQSTPLDSIDDSGILP